MKVCRTCRRRQALASFYQNRSAADGHQSECKECTRRRRHAWYVTNRSRSIAATQLGITLCRALNVPARYVAGYLPDIAVTPPDLPMDFCSWFEVWLEGRWWTFDPRNNEPRIGRVVIARGRDALDTAMVTTWGAAELLAMMVWADEVAG